MQERIIEMLGAGIPATQVAAAVGCDDSYISQLMSNEDIAAQVQALKAEAFGAHVEHDNNIDEAEKKVLARLVHLADFVTKPTEAARVFSILNAAKRRTADSPTQATPTAIGVTLQLPEVARVQFTVTADKQVIEIEGRSMITMPAKSLAARLADRQASKMLGMEVPTTLPIKRELVDKL